jgi:hypothetical protein
MKISLAELRNQEIKFSSALYKIVLSITNLAGQFFLTKNREDCSMTRPIQRIINVFTLFSLHKTYNKLSKINSLFVCCNGSMFLAKIIFQSR